MLEAEDCPGGGKGRQAGTKERKRVPSSPPPSSPLKPPIYHPPIIPPKRKNKTPAAAARKGGDFTALSRQQARFCTAYAAGHNAAEAAEQAGYSKKTACGQGARLLKNPEVLARIAELEQDAFASAGVTAEKVARELARIAFADATAYARVEDTEEGQTVRLTPTEELTADQRAAVSCIKQTRFGVEVQLCGKTKALELLGRHLAMFTDRTENKADGVVRLELSPELEELAE